MSEESAPQTRRSNFWFVLVGIVLLAMGVVFVVWLRYVEPFQRQAALLRHLQRNCELDCVLSPPVCPEWFPDSQKAFFRKCTDLQVNITWSDTGPVKLKGEDFRLLGEMPYLETVLVRNQVLSVKSLGHIMEQRTIKHLQFFNTKFEGAGFETLPEMPQLEELNLLGREDRIPPGRMISPVALAEVLKKTPNLKLLQLDHQQMPPRSDELMKAIGRLGHLEKLCFHNFYLTDRQLRILSEAATPEMRNSLRVLQISRYPRQLKYWYQNSFTDPPPSDWRRFIREPLLYPYPEGVTETGLTHLAVFTELESLALFGNEALFVRNFDNEENLAKNRKSLETVLQTFPKLRLFQGGALPVEKTVDLRKKYPNVTLQY